MATRHILEQTRRNSYDLAALKSRTARIEEKVDDLESKVGGLTQKVDGLIRDLPGVVRDTMREVVQERDRKK